MSESGLGFLRLIWPEWGAIGGGGVHAVTPLLVVVIWLIAGGTLAFLVAHRRKAGSLIDETRRLLNGVTSDSLWASREELSRRASAASPEVANAWREFNETLVASNGEQRVWNTVEAQQYFNEDRFAPRLVHNRFLAAMPTVLTTLGLLGTFLGLTVGLRGLDISSPDADVLKAGIQTLVAGAGLGFTASLWGVFSSLVVNFSEKLVERGVVLRLGALQAEIDERFELRSPEQSLSEIAASAKASEESLAVLHEKIGSQFQETFRAALEPALQQFADSAKDQSAKVFEDVARQFTSSFHQIGISLADGLRQSSDELRATLTYMADKLAEQADQHREQMNELQAATKRQVELLDHSLPRIVEGLDTAASRIGFITERFDAATENLDATSTRFETVSSRFGDVLTDSARVFDAMQARNSETAESLNALSVRMIELSTSTVQASERLESSATMLRDGFASMREQQEAYLESLDGRLTRQAESMSDWLTAYSAEVTKQTSTRMDEWNKHTSAFTSTMIQAAQALSDAIEEIGAEPATAEKVA